MVKFAESEKRGRGGEGGDRRVVPMMLERPKLSRALWESLKTHIMRERRQKKEELEAGKEEERRKRERENKKKQHAMTLEETKEEIANKQRELNELKKHKAELLDQFRKRFSEEEQRKQSQNYIKENEMQQTLNSYQQGAIPIASHHPQMLFPQTIVAGRPANLTTPVYKLPQQPSALDLKPILQQSAVKRPRSPSPPPPPPSNGPAYQPHPYAFKSISGSQASVVPVTLSTTKVGSSSSIYLGSGGPPYYHTTVQPSHIPISQYSSTVSTQPSSAVAAAYLSTGSAPPHPSAGPPIDDKHLSSVYLQHTSRGRYKGHMATLHQVEHKAKPSGSVSGGFPPPEGVPEKFYARAHHPIHGGVLPVHQAPPGSAKSGSITSGFPVRAAAPSSQPSNVTSNAHSYGSHANNFRTYM